MNGCQPIVDSLLGGFRSLADLLSVPGEWESRSSQTVPFSGGLLVVAHPDDECLWFSSVLGRVDGTVICLQGSSLRPGLGTARRASLSILPLPGVVSLELDQADSFGGADWGKPQLNEYGIALPNRPGAQERYRQNFHELKNRLRPLLAGHRHVFTHSPWGEYGHEEHIQIHRVVQALQQELSFHLWYPVYGSRKTLPLMRRQRLGPDAQLLNLKTDRALANRLKGIYQVNQCWTWYLEWEGFPEESFVGQSADDFAAGERGGKRLPCRFNRVEPPSDRGGVRNRIWGTHGRPCDASGR